ncbi:MAG: hypothetical protein JXA81_11055 [Sedimentisphaerales bacterium]|nr:hypothetical protein [Sedimentisphaerales bacterium]
MIFLWEFAPDSSSPGYDAGVVIPNFNDNYNCAAPYIGEYEADSPPMSSASRHTNKKVTKVS